MMGKIGKNVLYCFFAVLCIASVSHLVVIAKRAYCLSNTIHKVDSLETPTASSEVLTRPRISGVGIKQNYLLSFKYYEQQTQATWNFFGLQCLAHTFGMKIVEPFAYGSTISFPFPELASGRELLRFGDLMDMDLWNKQTTETFGYPPVAKWEEFLSNAPHDVVIVCIKYRNPPKIHIPVPGFNYRLGCKDTCFDAFNASLEFLGGHQFTLIRKVCANFVDYAGSVAPDIFLDDILGGKKIGSGGITVLLNEFRGFFGLYRLQVRSPCGIIPSTRNISVMPSQKLVKEAHRYSMNYLSGRPYVSILVRVEKIILHSHRNISECGKDVISILQTLKKEKNIDDYFLAMDVGKFGSKGSYLNNLQPHGETLFKQIYRDKWSFRDWEESFSKTSSNTNPAYIANLQRTIAAKGACLLMVGVGGFQDQARQVYRKYHPDPSSWCIYKLCLPI